METFPQGTRVRVVVEASDFTGRQGIVLGPNDQFSPPTTMIVDVQLDERDDALPFIAGQLERIAAQ